MSSTLIVGVRVWSLFCYAVRIVLSSFTIISLRKRELVGLLKLSSCCHVVISILPLFPVVPWVGQQCVIVEFPGHAHLQFERKRLSGYSGIKSSRCKSSDINNGNKLRTFAIYL